MTDPDEELSAGRLGRTVGGRWLLERVLGIGGMAAVYAARDPSGAVAAVKILHPEMSVRREIRERFLREGYVANRVGHPGAVQALEHGDSGDEVFLAMELLAGETLRARVQRHGKLPVGEVLDYADQILDVLAAAHEKGIVHRDLKPDNLFVSPEGRVKILDFGLARVLDGVPSEHRTRTGVALGTLAYMAPEQALGRRAEIDGRVDVFALGATMFRVLSGRRVHDAESEAELLMAMASRPAPPLESVIPGISPALAGVVDLALAFSRDARYPDARTMQGDVRALRQGQPGPYASARLSSREQATRAEAPAVSQRTQPLSATMQSHVRGTSNTMPMPAGMGGAGAPGPSAFAATQPPSSGRTAPLTAHAPGAYAAAPGPAAFGTTMPSTPAGPAFPSAAPFRSPVAAAKPARRTSLALFAVLGLAGLALAGGGAAWFFLGDQKAEASAVGSPSPALPEATAPPASSVAAPVFDTTPAVTRNDEASATQPLRKSVVKKDSAAPGASASAGAPLAPSSSSAPAAPAPTAGAESTAAPPAPPPPAPVPSPSVAPPAPPSPPPPSTAPPAPPPPKRGRGRGKND
ncbi:MAG TPA: serine/threonine-protein kinase [Polyangiaceae bacterium]